VVAEEELQISQNSKGTYEAVEEVAAEVVELTMSYPEVKLITWCRWWRRWRC
jgi:hypothetical protein